MFKAFRMISIIEGISYLVILAVTLGFISREFVFILGMTHGVLFLLYLVFSLLLSNQRGWSVLFWLLLFFAAFIPFAFIAVEWYLRKVQFDPVKLTEPVAET
jgi:integral membrane protein